MRPMRILGLAFVVLSFITAIYVCPQLPEQMASHWNIEGKVDGYMPKTIGLFFMPILAAIVYALFIYLPKLDPLKANYKSFMNEYDMMIALVIGFFYYVYLLTLAFNLGYSFDMVQFLSPAFGILFYVMGIIVGKAKQNWFVGIRTPWTLSSEKVWEKTHKICGDLFRAAGIVAFLGLAFPKIMFVASIAILVATSIFGIVYSYIEFGKEKRGKRNE